MKYMLISLCLLLASQNLLAGDKTGYYQYHPDTDRWSFGVIENGKKKSAGTVKDGKRARQEAKNECGNTDDCDTVKQAKDENEGDAFLPGNCGVPGACK